MKCPDCKKELRFFSMVYCPHCSAEISHGETVRRHSKKRFNLGFFDIMRG